MTDTASTSRTIYVRDCPHCGTEMEHGYASDCPECGWRMGLTPVAESYDDAGNLATLFVTEQPGRYSRISLITVTLGAFILLAVGAQASVSLTLLAAAALIVLAVVWRETRLGRVTYGLTPGMRALTKVVLAVGIVLVFCTVIGIALGWKGGDRLMGR